jgi:glutathione peroxidase
MSTAPLYDISIDKITGETTSLADYRGKVLLVVNVASKCGLTPQYDALEKVYSRFKDSGFVVCGFPANDFGAQEPGSNEDIQTFCRSTFGVDFPMFSKIPVTGPDTHPLYKSLIAARPKAIGPTRDSFRENLNGFLKNKHNGAATNPEPGILWNFEKFATAR